MCNISELGKRYNYLYYNNTQIMLTDYTIYFCLLWMSKFSIFHFIPGETKGFNSPDFQHFPTSSISAFHSQCKAHSWDKCRASMTQKRSSDSHWSVTPAVHQILQRSLLCNRWETFLWPRWITVHIMVPSLQVWWSAENQEPRGGSRYLNNLKSICSILSLHSFLSVSTNCQIPLLN